MSDAHSAETDATRGHGPDCRWDEDMVRWWCSPEHWSRKAAYRKAHPGWFVRLMRRLRNRVTPPVEVDQ